MRETFWHKVAQQSTNKAPTKQKLVFLFPVFVLRELSLDSFTETQTYESRVSRCVWQVQVKYFVTNEAVLTL